MAEQLLNEIERLGVIADELIESVKHTPKKAVKGIEKELMSLDKDSKILIKKIQSSSEKADRSIRSTWKELAERARKLTKKIDRSMNELVKQLTTSPADP